VAPDPLPERLPLSAELMIGRLEDAVMGCLAESLGMTDPDSIRLLRRDGSLSNLAAYPDGAPLAVVKIEVTEDGRAPWNGYLCMTEAMLPLLFGDGAGTVPQIDRDRADPNSEPFSGLPLELSAVLVDMRISMATIAAIQPGTVLPVAVARNVPLRIGGRTIATGSVGAADDRVAILITQAFG
jgi:flagellar motor switch protein FliM